MNELEENIFFELQKLVTIPNDMRDAKDILGTFTRMPYQICKNCSSEEVFFCDKYRILFYCSDCIYDEVPGFGRLDECLLCDKLDTYGYKVVDGCYIRLCKECFKEELHFFVNRGYNIKPAKPDF